MAAMIFCIIFNYSSLRSIKDSFIVTNIGPEAISFIKLYLVLPSAFLVTVIYFRMHNFFNQHSIFYLSTSFFSVFFTIFAFFLYPYADYIHVAPEIIEKLAVQYPNLKWFIRIVGNWSYALFFIFSELWGSVILNLLFWQFANQVINTDEARRFYPMFI